MVRPPSSTMEPMPPPPLPAHLGPTERVSRASRESLSRPLTATDSCTASTTSTASSGFEEKRPETSSAAGRKRHRRHRRKQTVVLYPADGWASWGAANIKPPQMVPILLMQAFSAGLLDATTYADFETFASNQTGNVILLTLAAVGTVPVKLLLTGVSLGTFLLAAFIFGHMANWAGPTKRTWLLSTTTMQLCCCIAACLFVSPVGPAATQIGARHEWATMFLLAWMSGAQVTSARQSKCQEIVTAPMTSPMVDLVTDTHLFKKLTHKQASQRNRRLAYVLTLITGSFIGSVMHKYTRNWCVVAASIGCKAVTVLLIAIAKETS